MLARESTLPQGRAAPAFDMRPTRRAMVTALIAAPVICAAVRSAAAGPDNFRQDGPVDCATPSQSVNGTREAVEVRGDSLGAVFAGWLVFYSQKLDAPFEQGLGRLCVVGLADERVLIKWLGRGSFDGRFNLYSEFEPPIHDADLLWAARVEAMAPR
jgi:hypothetical protein